MVGGSSAKEGHDGREVEFKDLHGFDEHGRVFSGPLVLVSEQGAH